MAHAPLTAAAPCMSVAVFALAPFLMLNSARAGIAADDDAERICRERYYDAAAFRAVRPSPPLPRRSGTSYDMSASRLSKSSSVMAYMPSTHMPAQQAYSAVAQPRAEEPLNRDAYPEADPNPVKITGETPVSTFGADVDRTSYALVRRHILEQHRLPPADAVRAEEIVNAFRYDYASPAPGSDAFRPTVSVYDVPWSADKKLLRIGIRAQALRPEDRPSINLVFLLDVSGSMSSRDKLPLSKTAVCMLLHKLNADDHVSLVVYVGAAGAVLEPTVASEREIVLRALDRLEAGGSTAGGAGIELAYDLAEKSFQAGGVNRVILASDGDFNVGISEPRHLRDFVARKRETGVFLSVLGFGLGNYRDTMMQSLAQNGNGIAVYIDGVKEARRVLVDDMLASLVTVARDVKFQVEFNPARVAEYRLIGYETRMLKRTEFNNDRVDSGDVGAGHTVTALYELTLVGGERSADPLRYGGGAVSKGGSREIAFLRIRLKPARAANSELIERPIDDADIVKDIFGVDADARFATAAAWFTELLRNSPHVPEDWGLVERYASSTIGDQASDERKEFLRLVRAARKISNREG